jgi:hypothetical protein
MPMRKYVPFVRLHPRLADDREVASGWPLIALGVCDQCVNFPQWMYNVCRRTGNPIMS